MPLYDDEVLAKENKKPSHGNVEHSGARTECGAVHHGKVGARVRCAVEAHARGAAARSTTLAAPGVVVTEAKRLQRVMTRGEMHAPSHEHDDVHGKFGGASERSMESEEVGDTKVVGKRHKDGWVVEGHDLVERMA